MQRLLARRNGNVLTRVAHPDFIMYDLQTCITIQTHQVIDPYGRFQWGPGTIQDTNNVIITPADVPEFLAGTRSTLVCSHGRYMPGSPVKGLALDCYSLCNNIGSQTWTAITDSDDLIYKLCAAVSAELFFAIKIEFKTGRSMHYVSFINRQTIR